MATRCLRGILLLVIAIGCDTDVVPQPAVEPAAAPSSGTSPAATWSLGRALPGAEPHGAELVARFQAAAAAREAEYEPRTRHRQPDGSPTYTNRLFLEPSPYLVQHAHNPVNWYPWGDAAFDRARTLGRPVLVSIGYSTCHWCHVMEDESYEDEDIARFINEHFIAVKVDREERPDIDAVYMEAARRIAGRGGWPLNVWLTPDREPFYAGTYYPPRDGDRGVRAGFLTVLRRLAEAYATRRDEVLRQSGRLADDIRSSLSPAPADDTLPDAGVLRGAILYYRDRYDPDHGGLRGSPKFPGALPVRLLLRHHRRTGDRESLEMAVTTLRHMAAGGLYDQIGGGVHRYATDPAWLIPHFEKMLYDNALLVLAYLEAFQVTGDADLADVARDILRYVRRDMTSPEGAFYASTDADSTGPDGGRTEGRFFTWTAAEIADVLGSEGGRLAAQYYGVTDEGPLDGRSVPHVARSIADVASGLGRSSADVREQLTASRARLYAARARRPAPLRDEKILTAWNGLMISAFARAALVLDDEGYSATAVRAAEFVLDHARVGDMLRRSVIDGRPSDDGYLDDQAWMATAMLDLHEATGDPRWLQEAIAIDRVIESDFENVAGGGFFLTAASSEVVLVRQASAVDGAEPSGSSAHTLNLLRLHELTTDDRYRRRAERSLRAHADVLEGAPARLAEMLLAVDFHADVPKQIVIVVPDHLRQAEPFLERLRALYVPNRMLVVARESDARHARLVTLLEGKTAQGGVATAYVCERRVCERPTTDPDLFARQVARVEPLRPAGASE